MVFGATWTMGISFCAETGVSTTFDEQQLQNIQTVFTVWTPAPVKMTITSSKKCTCGLHRRNVRVTNLVQELQEPVQTGNEQPFP